uniref:Small ribosomal subunit protein uS19m n=1 Tax=Symbiochloris sp. SG-2018 TaxID=2126034 RepID=A0A976U6L3_9CHLO|nr:ribosomal protein S19 [Symbiochloris sp. SG-2018]UVF37876.1 ribosomal protein S19 [Symbiochloris sp. SG-2018]
MTRSIWKGPFVDESLIRYLNRKSKTSIKNLRKNVWSRRSLITPEFLKKKLYIYNGKSFVRLTVSDKMIEHRFGEFAKTRKNVIHKKKKRR